MGNEIVPQPDRLPELIEYYRTQPRPGADVHVHYHAAPAPVAIPPPDLLARATPLFVVALMAMVILAMIAFVLTLLIPPFLVLILGLVASVSSVLIGLAVTACAVAVVAVAVGGSLGHLRKANTADRLSRAALRKGRRR